MDRLYPALAPPQAGSTAPDSLATHSAQDSSDKLDKSRLRKVVIETERFPQAAPLHQLETRAIDPIPLLVRISLAAPPCGLQQSRRLSARFRFWPNGATRRSFAGRRACEGAS